MGDFLSDVVNFYVESPPGGGPLLEPPGPPDGFSAWSRSRFLFGRKRNITAANIIKRNIIKKEFAA